jgi:hypothetical protein
VPVENASDAMSRIALIEIGARRNGSTMIYIEIRPRPAPPGLVPVEKKKIWVPPPVQDPAQCKLQVDDIPVQVLSGIETNAVSPSEH